MVASTQIRLWRGTSQTRLYVLWPRGIRRMFEAPILEHVHDQVVLIFLSLRAVHSCSIDMPGSGAMLVCGASHTIKRLTHFFHETIMKQSLNF